MAIQLNKTQELIDRFVLQEGAAAVKVMLDWKQSPDFLHERQKTFEFNTFDVEFDLDRGVVNVIDILDGSGDSDVVLAVADFFRALAEQGY